MGSCIKIRDSPHCNARGINKVELNSNWLIAKMKESHLWVSVDLFCGTCFASKMHPKECKISRVKKVSTFKGYIDMGWYYTAFLMQTYTDKLEQTPPN